MIERRRSEPHGRERVKADLELLALLPEDSEMAPALRRHIEESLQKMIEVEDRKRREPVGVVLGLLFIAIAIGLLVVGYVNGGAYWWLAAPAAVIGTFGSAGLAQDVTKQTRDERGRPTSQ
ncbi:hypothetical protein [Streptomyces sp. NPDC053560]|uniref:hypothetical protein n=1 Tax=Streptomyces sp. NPDC053560 TaxID=3365711 RepID=UPI0037D43361